MRTETDEWVQNQELTELRRECSDLRTSNKSMEIMLQNIAVGHYPVCVVQ